MPLTAKDYVLRFDLREFENELSEASRAFTDFGSTVRAVLGSVAEDATTLQQQAAGASASIAAASPQVQQAFRDTRAQFASTGRGLEDMSKYGGQVAKEMKALTGVDLQKVFGGGQGKDMAALEETQEKADYVLSVAQVADALVRASIQKAEENKSMFKKAVEAIKNLPATEWEGLKGAVGGVLSNVPGDLFGHGFIGGLIQALISGYKTNARLTAQQGQVANVIEASGEQLWGKPARKAINFFSSFQETARAMYGISLAESQGVLKTLVDVGYKSDDLMGSYNEKIRGAHNNLILASVALDKHFNQATGTAIKNITTITTELGDSLAVATHKYADIALAAQGTGMGVERFVNATMAGASAMQQYGVDVKDVANTMLNIQKHYESMGLSTQFSGAQAAKMIGEAAGTMTNLPDSYVAIVARRIYPELDTQDAIQKWREGTARVGRGEDRENFVQKSIVAMGEEAMETSRGNRTQAILRLTTGTGMSNQLATVIIDALPELKKHNDITKLGHEKISLLRGAFDTESTKINSLEKTEWKLEMSIKDIGTGLMKILVGILGVLINGFRSIPDVIGAIWKMVQPGHAREGLDLLYATADRQEKLFALVEGGKDDLWKGLVGFKEALGAEAGKTIDPILDALRAGKPKGTGPLHGTPKAALDAELKETKPLPDVLQGLNKLTRSSDTNAGAGTVLKFQKPEAPDVPEDKSSGSRVLSDVSFTRGGRQITVPVQDVQAAIMAAKEKAHPPHHSQ